MRLIAQNKIVPEYDPSRSLERSRSLQSPPEDKIIINVLDVCVSSDAEYIYTI